MTTPAAPPQAQQAPPPQPSDGLDAPALAIAVAAVLAGIGGPALTAAAAVAGLRARFALTSAATSALGAVLAQVMSYPPTVTGIIGPASAQTARMNAARRAQYVTAASGRVLGAEREARAKGQPAGAGFQAQLAVERRYYEQHQAAMWQRAAAAGRVDMEAATSGDLLGWLAMKGASPECAAASGWNFRASRMPDIGFPGGVHPSCKCQAVAAWPGGKLLPGSGPRYARAA